MFAWKEFRICMARSFCKTNTTSHFKGVSWKARKVWVSIFSLTIFFFFCLEVFSGGVFLFLMDGSNKKHRDTPFSY